MKNQKKMLGWCVAVLLILVLGPVLRVSASAIWASTASGISETESVIDNEPYIDNSLSEETRPDVEIDSETTTIGEEGVGFLSEALMAPTNLTADATDGRTIQLKWQHQEKKGVTYEVYQNQYRIGESDQAVYEVSDLAGGGTYEFQVKAYDEKHSSESSVSVSATTYGEILLNGNFEPDQSNGTKAAYWTLDADSNPTIHTEIQRDDQGHSVQHIKASELFEKEKVILFQESKVDGQQFYEWTGNMNVLASENATARLSVMYLDENKQSLGESDIEKLKSSETAFELFGQTPEGTSFVRIQLAIEASGELGSAEVALNHFKFGIWPSDRSKTLKTANSPITPRTFTYAYDANGRLTKIETDQGNFSFSYDANGNLLDKKRGWVVQTPEPELAAIGSFTSGSRYSMFSWDEDVHVKGAIFLFQGWYLNSRPIEKIECFWDGIAVGEAETGRLNEAIYAQYPEYENKNSGFRFKFNIDERFETMKAGDHTFQAVIHHQDGSTHTLEQTINFEVKNLNKQ